jgi:hypothetical protein
MRLIITSLAVAAAISAVPAGAKSYHIGVSAVVPVECELSTSGSLEAVGQSTYRVARVDQFCNTSFTLEVRNAPLAGSAVATFRGQSANVSAGSATLINGGRPVNDGADLFLSNASASDAQLFAQTLWLQVSPTGV